MKLKRFHEDKKSPKTIISIDIGGTLAKFVVFIPNNADHDIDSLKALVYGQHKYRESGYREEELEIKLENGTLHFVKFLTRRVPDIKSRTAFKNVFKNSLFATGGGAHKFATSLESNTGLEVIKFDEMNALVTGLRAMIIRNDGCFTLGNARFRGDVGPDREKLLTIPVRVQRNKSFLVVNIGSGVSVLHIKAHSYERVGGSSLGGSTFLGLVSLLTGVDNFSDALDLAANGDSTKVDLLVKDIYGDKLTDDKNGNMLFGSLRPSTLASSFGKMLTPESRKKASRADLALSCLVMCSMNISAIAHLHAKQLRIKHVVFTGNFLATTRPLRTEWGRQNSANVHLHPKDTLSLHKRNTISMRILSYAVSYWSKGTKQAVFLKHEGCLGALGAMLLGSGLQVPAQSREDTSRL